MKCCIKKYSDLTKGIRKLKDFQFKIHTDKSVKAVIQPHRRMCRFVFQDGYN